MLEVDAANALSSVACPTTEGVFGSSSAAGAAGPSDRALKIKNQISKT